MNRAMVANQVSIAQMVSLATWSDYLRVATDNIDNTIGQIPGVGVVTDAYKALALTVNQLVETFTILPIPIIGLTIEAISLAQDGMHVATAASTQSIVREVVKANDQRFQISATGMGWLAQNATDWDGFTRKYDTSADLTRQADLIMASRDKFTRDRSWGDSMTLVKTPLLKARLSKQGDTRLYQEQGSTDEDPTKWQWRGRDTLSLHVSYWGCRKWVDCGWRDFELPIGWAQDTLDSDPSDEVDTERLATWSENREAEGRAIADSMAVGENRVGVSVKVPYIGIVPYRDMTNLDKSTEEGRNPKLFLAVEIVLDEGDTRTSTHIRIGSDRAPVNSRNGLGQDVFGLPDEFSDSAAEPSSMSAVSKAEIYFERPKPRVAGQHGAEDTLYEYGNLFNPYWDVRLADADQERRLVWAGRQTTFPVGGSAGGQIPGGNP